MVAGGRPVLADGWLGDRRDLDRVGGHGGGDDRLQLPELPRDQGRPARGRGSDAGGDRLRNGEPPPAAGRWRSGRSSGFETAERSRTPTSTPRHLLGGYSWVAGVHSPWRAPLSGRASWAGQGPLARPTRGVGRWASGLRGRYISFETRKSRFAVSV